LLLFWLRSPLLASLYLSLRRMHTSITTIIITTITTVADTNGPSTGPFFFVFSSRALNCRQAQR